MKYTNELVTRYYIIRYNILQRVSWCSWLSRQSNTLKVSGLNPGEAIIVFIHSINCESMICLFTKRPHFFPLLDIVFTDFQLGRLLSLCVFVQSFS